MMCTLYSVCQVNLSVRLLTVREQRYNPEKMAFFDESRKQMTTNKIETYTVGLQNIFET